MNFLELIVNEILGFLGINPAIEIIKTGVYAKFLTYDGFVTLVYPIIPILLLIELVIGYFHKKAQTKVYQLSFLIYVLNRVISRYLSIGVTSFVIANFQKYALFEASFRWYWVIYGYIVWEFSHFIYHYLGHKVRLFWCLHSTHHAPEDMNLSVTYAHFFLEGPYADAIRGTICILAGLKPELLFFIMFIDGTYGAFIHVGENLIKDGRLGLHRLGLVGKFILSPTDHRIHHARNPLYMDTNFCNLLNIWDRVFKTYQPLHPDIEIEYGITRPIKGGFLDAYFGEFVALFKDMAKAGSLKNMLLYIVMPPGWSHTGDHKTAALARRDFLNNNQ